MCSIVWQYFTLGDDEMSAKCQICFITLKCKNKSTSGLIRHLRSKHSDNLNSGDISKRKCITGISYPQNSIVITNMQETISKLASIDGLSIYCISKSGSLRSMLEKEDIVLPKNPSSIMDIIYNTYLKCKDIVKMEIAEKLISGQRFSISFDEYTSRRSRRYLTVNLHNKDEYWNLGMIRILDSFSAEKMLSAVIKKLKEFDLEFKQYIVASVTDGASVMCKFGRISGVEHQLCYAHGLHLAVSDVIYKNQLLEYAPTETCSSESDDSDEEYLEDSSFIISAPSHRKKDVRFTSNDFNMADTIKKVRQIVRIFRKSSLKNDTLQKYVRAAHETELQLILDSPTRWNSLVDMLERFYKLRKCILKAMIDLKIDISMSSNELEVVNEIIKTLRPVKLGMERLGKRDTNLLSAEAILKFIISELTEVQTPFSFRMKSTIQWRIQERRNKSLVGLLKFLNNSENYEVPNETNSDLPLPEKSELADIAKKLLERLFIPQKIEQNAQTEKLSICEGTSRGRETFFSQNVSSLSDKLNHLIAQETRGINSNDTAPNFKNLSQELQFYEVTKSRTENLNILYNALLTIPPTSIEAERAFSAAGYFISKLRTNLSDRNIDCLCFLRHHFLKKK